MKKQKKLILSAMMLLMLASCGNKNKQSSSNEVSSNQNNSSEVSTNQDSSSQINTSETNSSSDTNLSNKGEVSFETAIKYLNNATLIESEKAIKTKAIKKDILGNVTYEMNEEYNLYNDLSSSSEGILKKSENNEIKTQDNFIRRTNSIVEKIENQGQVFDYDVYVSILDYEQDVFNNYEYQDSVSKVFIVDSENQAIQGGLQDGEYVLKDDVSWESSAKASHTLASFIYSNYYGNVYVSQLGETSINYVKDNEGNFVFSQSISYNYNGDMNDVQYFTLSISFTLASDDMRLIAGYCESTLKDISLNDETDAYTKTSSNEFTLTYGKKVAPSSGLVDVNDYFLSKVNDIQICDSYGNVYNANNVPVNATYIHAEALDYEPKKAILKTLVNASTSDSNIVAYEDGYFKILNTGTVSLTFSYSGKENGVSKIMNVTKEITIVLPNPTSIYIYNNDVNGDTLTKGQSYVYQTFLTPSGSNQEITVAVEDEKILTATINEDNDVIINALEAGSTTITVKSKVDPSISATKTIYVEDPNIDYTKYLTEHKYHFETDLYSHYAFDLVFKDDGTGQLIQTIFDSSRTYVETFNWSLKGLVITFSNWSTTTPSYYQFDTMEIQLAGKVIYFTGGEEFNYKSYKFIDYENYLPLFKYERNIKEGELSSKETFIFNRDKTGTKVVETYNKEGEVDDLVTYTFNWSLDGSTIIFSLWSENANEEDKLESIQIVYDADSLRYNNGSKNIYFNKK